MQAVCQEENTDTSNVSSVTSKAIIWKIVNVLITVIVIFLGGAATLICRSVSWALKTWSDLSIEEIVYHLKMPLKGTNSDMITDYVVYCVILSLIVIDGLIVAFVLLRKKHRVCHIMQVATAGITILAGFLGVRHFWKTLDVSAYIENQNHYSSFIDDHYIDPAVVPVTFPEQKRNLIYIFLESMENTYADQAHGGAFEENVIPELTELSLENENFSGGTEKLDGGHALTGATWTIGAMFAQTSGLPLTIPIASNSMSTQSEFFPGITALGDILEQEGYKQTLLIGSDASFGGRDLYFEQHGNYAIHDYDYAIENGQIPSDYYVWWGYEDKILFENAKNELEEMAGTDEPFNLTILTVDTHFEDGYYCSECQDTYGEDQYSNAMACSSRQVSEFVKWIQEQPFYENTTIVISGDHPTMDSDYCESVDADYERTVYTTYINPAASVANEEYRIYSTMDQFPTTLASLGAEIPGNRLGLGVNLFSEEATLLEQYGLDEVNKGLSQKSVLMEELVAGINQKLVDIEVSPYDVQEKTVTITVSDIQWGDGMTAIFCGIWSDEEQKDIQWYDTQEQPDGSYLLTVPASDFAYRNGSYNVHVYARMRGQADVFLGGTYMRIEDPESSGLDIESNMPAVSGEIYVEPYDYRTGKFEVSIKNISSETQIMALRCAVWSEENQEDLWWYEGELSEDGSYVVDVFARDFQYRETVYNVHVYVIDATGTSVLLGTAMGEIN